MVGFEDFFALAQQAGVFHFYLPFVLVFAIFYGLLTKSGVFSRGQEKDNTAKRLNAVISLIAALYVVGFTPVGVQLISFADYIGTLFTDAAVVIVTLFVFLMVFMVLSPTLGWRDFSGWGKMMILVAILIALAIFFNAGGGGIFGFAGNLGAGLGISLSGQDIAIIVLILVTVGVIYWMTSEKKEPEGKRGQQ
jgi:hypothetical protein